VAIAPAGHGLPILLAAATSNLDRTARALKNEFSSTRTVVHLSSPQPGGEGGRIARAAALRGFSRDAVAVLWMDRDVASNPTSGSSDGTIESRYFFAQDALGSTTLVTGGTAGSLTMTERFTYSAGANLRILRAGGLMRTRTHKRANSVRRPRGSQTVQALGRADAAWRKGDLSTAFTLYLEAAKHGVRPAFGIVAQFYDFGEGTKANRREAARWYRRAYWESSDAAAANNLGCILRDENQIDKALWWYRRAIASGHEVAHLNLARIFLSLRKDRAKALHHLRLLLRGNQSTEGAREEAARLMSRYQAS